VTTTALPTTPALPEALALRVADGLALPFAVVTEKLAFLAQSGAGKSYAAMRLAELMLTVGAQVVALDPVGVWWALRSSADGTGPGFPIVVFGGEHGDLPLRPDAGALVADAIVERGVPAVLDISEFMTAETKRFVADFADRFFQRKKRAKSPVHLFFEEAQTIAPQVPERDETVMLNRVERLLKLGRNYGVGWSLISQQPQSVNKKVLNQAGTLFALRTVGRHERKAIADWVADKATSPDDLDLQRLLPSLDTGVAHVWSPSFLHVSMTVRISPRITYDSSRTPEFGDDTREPRQLAPVDVEALRAAMAPHSATGEEAEDDHGEQRAQRRRISALERELHIARAQTRTVVEHVEIPAISGEDLAQLRRLVDGIADVAQRLQAALASIPAADQAGRTETPREQATAALPTTPTVSTPPAPSTPPTPPVPHQTRTTARQRRERPPDAHPTLTPALSEPQRRILDALAWFEALGVSRPARGNVAVFSDTSPSSGAYGNNLGRLRTLGLVDYPAQGHVALTDVGRAQAAPPPIAATREALHAAWYAKLPPRQGSLLRHLVAAYPRPVSRDDLANLAGVSSSSGSYGNNLGTLRSLGVIDYPKAGQVVATALLFPEVATNGARP